MSEPIKVYACLCGAQCEGMEEPPLCWLCGAQMYQWKTRVPQWRSTTLEGEAADKRNEAGGY